MYLSIHIAFSTPYIMIYNLSAHHNIHYFQAAVYTSCYTGADDTVGLEGTDQFYSTGSSVHFTYSAFHQDNGIISNAAFSILERTFGVFFLVFEQLRYCFCSELMAVIIPIFINSTLFMAANVRIFISSISYLCNVKLRKECNLLEMSVG